MLTLHRWMGFAVVGVFAVGWLWGLGAWILRKGTGDAFWAWLTVAQVTAGLQAIAGIVLLVLGYRPSTWLHYVYGFGPLVVLVIAHYVARETKTMQPNPRTGRTMAPWVPFAWAAFICFGLTLRAVMTGLGVG